jgi:hypothetical protein
MSEAGDLFKQLQDRQTEAMKQYQDAVTDTMKAWQDAFAGATRSAEGGTGGSADDAPGFPTPAQLADSYFSFAEEVLARQHEFALKMIEAMTPSRS